jgi:hypothetical protein
MQYEVWGIMWRSHNKLDGKREHLLGDLVAPHGDGHPHVKPAGGAVPTLTFKTRRAAAVFIKDRYGYINEPGGAHMKKEPHGWKMPVPVRVRISVEPV